MPGSLSKSGNAPAFGRSLPDPEAVMKGDPCSVDSRREVIPARRPGRITASRNAFPRVPTKRRESQADLSFMPSAGLRQIVAGKNGELRSLGEQPPAVLTMHRSSGVRRLVSPAISGLVVTGVCPLCRLLPATRIHHQPRARRPVLRASLALPLPSSSRECRSVRQARHPARVAVSVLFQAAARWQVQKRNGTRGCSSWG